jgi:hypothetical protein
MRVKDTSHLRLLRWELGYRHPGSPINEDSEATIKSVCLVLVLVVQKYYRLVLVLVQMEL